MAAAPFPIPWDLLEGLLAFFIAECKKRNPGTTPESVMRTMHNPGPLTRRKFRKELEKRAGKKYTKAQVEEIMEAACAEAQMYELADIEQLMTA